MPVTEAEFQLTIPGNPVPWAVYTKQGPPPIGFNRMVAWQGQIQLHLRRAWGNQEPLSGPVVLDAEFFLPWPESAPQRETRAIEKWYWKHLVMKPDLDKLRKALSDSFEGILFHGDQQVVRGESRKDILSPNLYVACQEGYTRIRFRPFEVTP